MKINTRLAVAIHVMALIELNRIVGIANTSENLALSVNTNPVVIRRILSQMKKAGLASVAPGVGGASLCRPPEGITWLDVFNAVKRDDDFALFNKHPNPNAKCYVGAYIHETIDGPLRLAQNALEEKLSTFTLLDAVVPIAEKNGIPYPSAGDTA